MRNLLVSTLRLPLALTALLATLVTVALATSAPSANSGPRRRDERGDVPGWVMVTVMSVGIVMAISAFAKPELTGMVKSALAQVK